MSDRQQKARGLLLSGWVSDGLFYFHRAGVGIKFFISGQYRQTIIQRQPDTFTRIHCRLGGWRGADLPLAGSYVVRVLLTVIFGQRILSLPGEKIIVSRIGRSGTLLKPRLIRKKRAAERFLGRFCHCGKSRIEFFDFDCIAGQNPHTAFLVGLRQ